MPTSPRTLIVARRGRAPWGRLARRGALPKNFSWVYLPSRAHPALQLLAAPLALWRALRERPDVVVFATTSPANRAIARAARRLGVAARTLTFDQFLSPEVAADFDAIAVYSDEETARYAPDLRAKCREILYPAKAEALDLAPSDLGYVFASGNHGRDWRTFAAAAALVPEIPFVVVTGNEIDVPLPANCDRRATMPEADYYRLMAGARLAALPLKESLIPHGQCDAASATWLGKPIVSSAGATVDAYARPAHAALVPANDPAALAAAVRELWESDEARAAKSAAALARRGELSLTAFASRLGEICAALAAAPRPQDPREICGDVPLARGEKLRFLGRNFSWNAAGAVARISPRRYARRAADGSPASPFRSLVDGFFAEELPKILGPAREISVVDIGGGSGYARGLLAEAGYRGRYLSVDPVPDARFASRGNPAFESRQVAELFERFESDDRFDLVLSVTSLEHVPEVAAAVANAARLRAPGGVEVHVVPGGWSVLPYLWHGWRQFSRGRLADLFGADAEIYALGGIASLALHLAWCTVPERLTASDRLRRTAAYRAARRLAQRIDRALPFAPIAYVAVRRGGV